MTFRSVVLLGLLGCGISFAQEGAVFTPPQAYPKERYEAMWGKNPFTLKTAPAVVESVSFAKDLAIASHYGDAENPTIVIVNMKTHERIRLKKGGTSANGVTLKSVKLGDTRKETTVEVTLGSETTEIGYNSDYSNQVAATQGGQAPGAIRTGGGAAPAPGMQLGVPPAQMPRPGMPASGVRMPTPPTMARPGTAVLPAGGRNAAGVVPGGMPAAASRNNGSQVSAVVSPSANSGLNLTVSTGNEAQAPQGVPVVSQANPNAPPVPQRRRMISPANEQALPQ